MAHIEKLPSHIAELIAAGEVVERPASVVKELAENAIDAGADAIVAEVRRGGMELIRVTDNGCGIAANELPTAFLRHATSKLRTAEDLSKIGTLGFRGEALAAIAAVSRTQIVTRTAEDAQGASLRVEGGAIGETESVGAPQGTTIRVADLFYNTPARLKFMKKDSAETAAAAGLVQHLALSRPDISFQFIKDGEETLHTPGDGRLLSAIYAALGREFAKSLIEVRGEGSVSVSGYVTSPLACRGSRSMQTFFVNGRFIKSQLLTAALEEAYRNQMMKGKFPGCVLHITLPVTQVDVNVHPAKTQIKFEREREVFDAVYHTVLDALNARSEAGARREEPQVAPREDFFRRMDAKTYRAAPPSQSAPPSESAPQKAVRTWNTELRATQMLRDSARQTEPRYAVGSVTPAAPTETCEAPKAVEATEQAEQIALTPPEPKPWRIAGEVLRTYIVCEDEEENVWLIDKHAAHERLNFDRLKERQTPPMRQTLLTPVAAELGGEDAALLLEQSAELARLGFSCEDFGGGTLMVREIPADLPVSEVVSTLEAFASDLRAGKDPDERREALLRTMACKASIKGGWESDLSELRVLAEKVQSGAIRYCPHGRPVAVKLTKYELEKMFRRA